MRVALRDRILRARASGPTETSAQAPREVPLRESPAQFDFTSIDQSVTAILDEAAVPGSIERAFAERESRLCAVLATVPTEARSALRARFAEPPAGDVVANRFSRLALERRARVLKVLDDKEPHHAR